MKVKELIEELSKMDVEKEVWIEGSSRSDDAWEVNSVTTGVADGSYGSSEDEVVILN